MQFQIGTKILGKALVLLIILIVSQPVSAIEAQKPVINLAERIQLENKNKREQFYGDVRLLHSPNLMDAQFSEDGSVLFSQAETIRLWRSDNGEYIGSIAGPVRFSKFAQLNHSRWIVTLDETEMAWDLYDRIQDSPQVIPHLRIWDTITGECLGDRRLSIPVNASRIWIRALETAEQYQTTFVIIDYDTNEAGRDGIQDYQRILLVGYHGQKLEPTSQFELRKNSSYNSMTWDSHTRQLYLSEDYGITCYDPVSKKIVWKSSRQSYIPLRIMIDRLVVLDRQPFIDENGSDNHQQDSSILVIYRPEYKGKVLARWDLIDSHSGNLIKSGVVNREFAPTEKIPDKNRDLIYWFRDLADYSINAIDIQTNKLLLRITREKNGFRRSILNQKWYLERLDYRTDAFKVFWNPICNRVCAIFGYSSELEVFDLKTGNPVADFSGTVNSLSKISADKITASLDGNEISVYEFKPGEGLLRTFNKKVLNNSCVALSADATILLEGKSSGKVDLWNLSSQKQTATLTGGKDKLICLAADTSRNKIVACDNTGTFWWWKYPIQYIAQSDEIQRLKAERKVEPTLPDYQKAKYPCRITRSQCDISPDTSCSMFFKPIETMSLLYSPEEDPDVEEYPYPGRSLAAKLEENFLGGGAYSLERKIGIVIVSEDDQKSKRMTPSASSRALLIQVKISMDGCFALFVFEHGQIIIVNLQTGMLESSIHTRNREIVDVNYHHVCKTLLVASFRGTVTAWDSETSLKTGMLSLYDARLRSMSSRPVKDRFDIVLGSQDTGLILKTGVFKKSDLKSEKP
ncbi:MAG: hypothetical protein KDA74_14325, partial [Planctomycetaceae bacterium]|nr:hypothetical protein [Planctomycetaceae bacterium]